jgi:hypothetical protein
VRELARRKGAGTLVADTLDRVIQRADELGELVALYWTPRKQPLSAGVKRGLAKAFTKFDDYHLAKYNRDGVVRLGDVLFLSHAKPLNAEQAALWKRLVENTLDPPDTWEVALSARKDKRETWERLLREEKLGGMAELRNLRLMLASAVEPKRIAAAAGLAILLREVAADFAIATFSEKCVTLPARRGLALRDAIAGSQPHTSTYVKRALVELCDKHGWEKLDRVIVITDEQCHDGIAPAWTPKSCVVNVAPYQHGVNYGDGWTHIDGWSERIVDCITAIEAESAEKLGNRASSA